MKNFNDFKYEIFYLIINLLYSNVIKKIRLYINDKEYEINIINKNENFYKKLLEKIKTKEIDVSNVEIRLSKKDLKRFIEEYPNLRNDKKNILHLYNLTSNKKFNEKDKIINKIVVLKNGNIFIPNITEHARKQFIKRLLLFYEEFKNKRKFAANFPHKIKKDVKEIINIIYQDPEIKKEKSKEILDNIIIKYLQNSRILKQKTLYRTLDKKKFSEKMKKYKDENDYLLSHPFLFIIDKENKTVITIVLYSSSFPEITNLNHEASNYKHSLLSFLKKIKKRKKTSFKNIVEETSLEI